MVRSPVYTPAASPVKVGWTLTVAGCVARALPDGGDAGTQFKPPVPLPLLPVLLEKDVARNVRGSGDGLVMDIVCAVGAVPPATPKKINPVGCTNAPGLLAG